MSIIRKSACRFCDKTIRAGSRGNWGTSDPFDGHPWYCDDAPDHRHEPVDGEALREDILSYVLGNSAVRPTVREVARGCGCTTAEARRVLKELAAEGKVAGRVLGNRNTPVRWMKP